MQIEEHFIRIGNHRNDTICISKLIPECVFHSSQKSGNYIKPAPQLLFHFLVCVHATNSLYLWLAGEEGKAERKGTRSCFIFSSPPVIIFSGWLVQGSNTSKKEKFSDHLCFLEYHRVLSALVECPGSNEKPGLLGLSGPPYSAVDVTLLPCTHSVSC